MRIQCLSFHIHKVCCESIFAYEHIKILVKDFPYGTEVKDLAFSLQQPRLLLWFGLDSRPGYVHIPWAWPKKKTPKNKQKKLVN